MASDKAKNHDTLECGTKDQKVSESQNGSAQIPVKFINENGEWSPFFLEVVDGGFQAKYIDQYFIKHKRRTIKEKVYLFLEYPAGWFGFFYHTIM